MVFVYELIAVAAAFAATWIAVCTLRALGAALRACFPPRPAQPAEGDLAPYE